MLHLTSIVSLLFEVVTAIMVTLCKLPVNNNNNNNNNSRISIPPSVVTSHDLSSVFIFLHLVLEVIVVYLTTDCGAIQLILSAFRLLTFHLACGL